MNIFAANLSTIFTEVPFIERFKKAKQSGFNFVECQFPYSVPVSTIQKELEMNQLTLVLINIQAGDWENGERGLAIYPERITEFKEAVAKGIEYAQELGVNKLHCLAGIVPADMDLGLARKTYIENLTFTAEQLANHQMTLLIEPINQLDMPGYFLNDIDEAVRIIEEINMPNLKLQFDFYHLQKTKGNLLTNFKKYIEKIEHVQIADVPGRHEPNTGEIHYQRVLAEVSKSGYCGFIGLEYIPSGKSEDSFSWLEPYWRGEIVR